MMAEGEIPLSAVPPDFEIGELVVEEMRFPIYVSALIAKVVEDDMGEKVYAYEVTLASVLPEAFAALLLRKVRDHKIVVVVEDPEEGTA